MQVSTLGSTFVPIQSPIKALKTITAMKAKKVE
jgi:hypothetical protein